MDNLSHKLEFLACTDGARLAYRRREGAGPGVVWLGGFRSDMTGTKAAHLHAWAEQTNRAYVRFDYFGHGASDGDFADGTISRWRDDARAVVEQLTQGPQILVGSSMGAWIALLLARAVPERIHGLVLIAPAPDFTEKLMWDQLTPAQTRTLDAQGYVDLPSEYGAPYRIEGRLIEDGRTNLVLDAPLEFGRPIRILQGMADADVPWRHALKIADVVTGADMVATLVKDGDHRLSTPENLQRIVGLIEEL